MKRERKRVKDERRYKVKYYCRLLNYGASLDATDMNNMTPYDIIFLYIHFFCFV